MGIQPSSPETQPTISLEELYNLQCGESFSPLSDFSAPIKNGVPMTNDTDQEYAKAKAIKLKQSGYYNSVRIVNELHPQTKQPTGKFGVVLIDNPHQPTLADETLNTIGGSTPAGQLKTAQALHDFLPPK